MAEIDVRDTRSDEIDKIVFSERDYIGEVNDEIIEIYDGFSYGKAEIFKSDIPNLIKALQKAMELWN